MDLLRFSVMEGERHQALFRCAAWLTEQGAPDTLVYAMLTEPGLDVGLPPKDVERQIRCGIDHARKQRQRTPTAAPPDADDDVERWAIQHEGDPVTAEATAFPFGALAPSQDERGEGGPA